MDWSISYIGVGIAALFAAMGGVVLGVMFGLATRLGRERIYTKILAGMRRQNEDK